MSLIDKKKWVRMYDVASEYSVSSRVGRGTFGTVFKATNIKENKNYAIKKLENTDPKMISQGFPITALRQIMLLKQMDHPNIIKLKQIILSKPSARNMNRGSTFLVFQYMDHDLAGIFRNKMKFSLPQIKCLAQQILEGIRYLHSLKLLHRDIKSANILLNKKGELKIGDFGLGRKWKAEGYLTHKVVTLWYRAPQLILGCKSYDFKVDVWSIGCVLAQFLTGQILFKKQTDFSQLQRILQIMGDYDTNKVPKQIIKTFTLKSQVLPLKSYARQFQSHMRSLNPQIGDDAIQLLAGLLDLNPRTRLTCQQALKHPFFTNSPQAVCKGDIKKFEYQMKQFFKQNSSKIDYEEENKRKNEDEKKYQRYEHNEGKYHHKDKYYDKKRPDQKRPYSPNNNYQKRYHKYERKDQHYHNRDKKQYSSSSSISSSSSYQRRSRQKKSRRNYEDSYDSEKKYGNRQHHYQRDYSPRRHFSSKYTDRNEKKKYQKFYDKDSKGFTRQKSFREQPAQKYKSQFAYKKDRNYRKRQRFDERSEKSYDDKRQFKGMNEGDKYRDDYYRSKQQKYKNYDKGYRQNHSNRQHREYQESRSFKQAYQKKYAYDRYDEKYDDRQKYDRFSISEKQQYRDRSQKYDKKDRFSYNEEPRIKKSYQINLQDKKSNKYDQIDYSSRNNTKYDDRDHRHRYQNQQRRDERSRDHTYSKKRQHSYYRERSHQKRSRSRQKLEKLKRYSENEPYKQKQENIEQKSPQRRKDKFDY